MHAMKKLLRIVFALAGLLSLAALGLTVFGPWTGQALALFRMDWYSYLVQALMAITAIGLIVNLFQGILSRKNDSVIIDRLEGGQLVVSRDAIASQAAHIVEADGTCVAQDVRVSAKRKGHVKVDVKVLPHSSVDVVSKGQALHDQLAHDLAALCGNNIDSISLEFLQPETATDLAQATSYEPAYTSSYEAPAFEPAPAPVQAEPAYEPVAEATPALEPAAAAAIVEPTVVAPATADNPVMIIEPSAPASDADFGHEEA